MIKISHESPLCMLEQSRSYNDYDYALVHLFDKEPRYLKFFQDSLDRGRTVLLDNSIFELGKAFDANLYRKWICTLKPTEYIVPDVLEDCIGTINNMDDWLFCRRVHGNLPASKVIGVVQGKNYAELVRCYAYMDQHADKIAISFDYSYYLKVFPHPNKWVSYMMGRIITLNQLMYDGIINKHKPHHLLGCAHPREFSFYTGPEYGWIESVDTSSPIVHGIKGIDYSDRIGTWEKEKTKLVDLLHITPTAEQHISILYNIRGFRKYCTP